MADSPRKRRRLSTDAQKTSKSKDSNPTDFRDPATPTRRASYLAPTKASLSRSHPNILAKSPKRGSLTEPRGRLLRQELLGSKQATTISLYASKDAPAHSHSTHESAARSTNDGENAKDLFTEAIVQSFASVAPAQSTTQPPYLRTRTPLQSRNPTNSTTDESDIEGNAKEMAFDDLPVPKLVTREDLIQARQQSEARGEPELPPTPVQLGYGIGPERPRGLASSSSMGSGSASGRHRRRVRNGQAGTITSSPLKLKATRPVSPIDFSDLGNPDHELAQEALESDVEAGQARLNQRLDDALQAVNNLVRDDLPAELREKLAESERLQAELQLLKNDLGILELVVDQLQHEVEPNVDDGLIQLLELDATKKEISLQSPESHPAFMSNPSAYLNLFTPGGLLLEHETTTLQVQNRTKVGHRLRMAPKFPVLQKALETSLHVQIDALDARIDAVTTDAKAQWKSKNRLDDWITERLVTPLYRFDVSGIVHGAGSYFEASVVRAQVFQYIDKRYNKGSNEDMLDLSQKQQELSDQQALLLSRYLEETQLLISPRTGHDFENSKHKYLEMGDKQIMLTYEINLTWTGDVVHRIDICLCGESAKGQQGVKQLFARLLPIRGAVMAFEAIWNVLAWDDALVTVVDAPAKRPSKRRKVVLA